MKAKIALAVGLLAAALAAQKLLSTASPQPGGIGRYQIVAGTMDALGTQRPNIVRIDTATGRAWLLSCVPNDNGCQMAWVSVPEWSKPISEAPPK
jgi:hypothetical protein